MLYQFINESCPSINGPVTAFELARNKSLRNAGTPS
jgi:hypothetical protein